MIYLLLLFLPFKPLSQFEANPVSKVFYDEKGELLQVTALEDGSRCEYTGWSKLPAPVKKIFIKAEDKRFYFHDGVDLFALANAAIQNARNKKIVRGGSTITMQLVKMITKDRQVKLSRKLNDIFYAHLIEARCSKKKIFELYINNLFFGHGATGIGSAARTFYGCSIDELSPQQLCCLAIIPRNPAYYDPIKNPEACAQRACKLYNKIYRKNIPLQDFYSFLPVRLFDYPFEAPHYIRYYSGLTECSNYNSLTINLELQKYAEKLLREALLQAQDSRISNASLLLIDNETGKPLVYVGNADFFDQEHNGQLDGVTTTNQPGSSMKPFLYALALESNDEEGKALFTPSTILADIPMEFGDEKLYIPSNFNNRYNGPVRFRVALASSLNVPAVYILNTIGVNNYLDKLFALGFDSLRKSGKDADLGLALGAGEVSLKELVTAFAIFPRDGIDFKGQQLYQKDTARIICSILSDKAARALGFGYSQTFETAYPAIFKTGTSNQFQDIIALGATKQYTVGVWMGNFSGKTVVGKTGSSLPAWVAKNLLDYIYGNRESYKELEFEEPENWTKAKICSLSGELASPNCPATVNEYCKNDLSYEQCHWHQKQNGIIQTLYPPEYQQWARSVKQDVTIEYSASPLYIKTPRNNSLFYFSELHKEKQAVTVEVFGGSGNSLQIFYDDNFYKEIDRPFIFQLPVDRGRHSCKVICGKEEDQIDFLIK
ncbi:MAG: transglycosylase domain-containing protein [Treponema sp.]|nr:transglycosylase domain-containing protein [Treponema sp.]